MAIFHFDSRDGNVDVSPATVPRELEMAVARTTPIGDFLTHPAHLMGILPTLGGVAQVLEIQVVQVQRGA